MKGSGKMPNFTTPIPPRLTGKTSEDVENLKKWGTALVDELTYLFNNLDKGNVIEAASVKAENIETNTAKISNAQIGNLTADKLVSGSVDTELVSVQDEDGNLNISGSQIVISDKKNERFVAAYDKDEDIFNFVLYNENGEPTVNINSRGEAVFSGEVESSAIFSSTIIGTDKDSFEDVDGDVFANIDKSGIKVMQDKRGERLQKIGMSVADDGTAYLILGAGDGSGEVNINGVIYTDGTMALEKNESYGRVGIIGGKAAATFWVDSENLWLNGNKVLINNRNILNEIDYLENRINQLSINTQGE